MPLSVQSGSQFQQSLQNGITSYTNRVKNFSPGSVLGAITNAFAAMLLFLQSQAQYIVNVTRAATSTGVDLTSFVTDYQLSPNRLPLIAPSGQVTFSKYQAASTALTVPVGVVIQTNAIAPAIPIQYTVIADPTNVNYSAAANGYVLAAGNTSMSVTVQAVVPSTSTTGSAYNALAGTLTVIVTASVPMDTVTNPSDITNGIDQETDAALRVRFQYYISSLAKATKASIQSAIASVQNGLTFTLNDGLNASGSTQSAYFTVVVDDGSGAIPAATLTNVLNAVNAVRAAGIGCSVIAPNNTTITVNVTGTVVLPGFVAANVRSAIQSAVIAYINGNGVGGYSATTGVTSGKLYFVGVANVVAGFIGTASTQGLSSYGSITVNGGSSDVTLTAYQLARASAASVTVS